MINLQHNKMSKISSFKKLISTVLSLVVEHLYLVLGHVSHKPVDGSS